MPHILPAQLRSQLPGTVEAPLLDLGAALLVAFHDRPAGRRLLPSPYPFTHTTCLSVYTTSTRSFCASITASMSL